MVENFKGNIMSWVGFSGRKYLFDYEHETYLKRPPVRYSARNVILKSTCEICGGKETVDNKFQISHKIPFIKGIIDYKLTPDFLDSPEYLMTAHRKICNKKAEMSESDIIEFLNQ